MGTTTIPRVVLKFPEDLKSTSESTPDGPTPPLSNTISSTPRPKRKRQASPRQPSARSTQSGPLDRFLLCTNSSTGRQEAFDTVDRAMIQAEISGEIVN